MTWQRVEWNGLDLKIYRNYGTLADHFELWTPIAGLTLLWRALSTAGATPVGTAALEAFRVAEGIPVYGIDIAERDLPQETSQTRALHFSKGCYLGQEIVERIRSRGNVHRHLRQLELDGPAAKVGAELFLEARRLGRLRAPRSLALGGERPPICAGNGARRGRSRESAADLYCGRNSRNGKDPG